jgi:uncharacterized protein (DUF1810 family)
MWYVFPQLKALAKSETARYFGIRDRTEALAYLDDSVLRVRLAEATMAVLRHRRSMFSDTDKRKLQACMTLFREVVKDPTLPNQVLDKWYDGEPHQLTLDVLAGKPVPVQQAAPRWHQPTLTPPLRRGAGDPMLRSEIEALVRRYGLSAEATRRLTDEWLADRVRAINIAWDEADATFNR